MTRNRKLSLLALVTLVALVMSTAGCESESPVEPREQATAPVLPDPERLTIDLSFFDGGADAAKSADQALKTNFVNAYLRAVVIGALTELVLAPPITAFAVALHTIPSPQPDGSWIWVYTHVDGVEEFQIRLRGEEIADGVDWELRVTASSAVQPLDNEIWFTGQTRDDGEFGHWTFFDPNLPGNPAVADLDWGHDIDGDYLMLTCLAGDDAGDSLTYRHQAPLCAIEFYDDSAAALWYIRWNEQDGTGSLMVPDYNGGDPACWDENQNNAACEPLP